ncbi:MAG: RNA pseudouridine synthase [Bacteroidota bacterium]|nr:RNA pseudouridine synthase [Bacteroidota bacterium]
MEITKSDILYEDNHLIAINKKPSQIVQGDKTGDIPLVELVKSYIKKEYNKPGDVFLGLPHRLDRPVSGVVLFAKTGKALVRINKMFKDKTINKSYWAIVKNMPPAESGTLIHFLKRNNKQNKSYAYEQKIADSKMAELYYRIIGTSNNYFLLEVILKTGRHHQIRAQLSKVACPVKGDLKYGFNRSNPDGSIHLHARKVSFIHPVSSKPIEIIAQTPVDKLWDMFN